MNYNFKTLPGIIEYISEEYSNIKAFNYRKGETWEALSTGGFVKEIQQIAMGLKSMGIEKGTTVGILAKSSHLWLIADFAIMCVGGVSVPFFINDSKENFEFKIDDAKLEYIFVFGDWTEACDIGFWKLIEPCKEKFKTIITHKVPLTGDNVITYEELSEKGKKYDNENPGIYTGMVAQVKEDDLATIIYTSGATGTPKGVELTNNNFVSQVKAANKIFELRSNTDNALSCLPLAHSFERMVMYFYISKSVNVFFVSNIEDVGRLLKDIKPQIMTAVPRLIEKVFVKLKDKINSGPIVKKIIGKIAINFALKMKKKRGLNSKLIDILDGPVYSKIREAFGGRIRNLILGGAPLTVELTRFFVNVGVPIYEGYGLTEASPVLTANCPANNKIGTVGKVIPGVEVKIAPNGEILGRGPNVMRGYHNRPELTAKMIDQEGWLHTGDLGRFDEENYLIITGRIKEMLKTSTGKYICPIPIEQALCKHRLFDMAHVVAEGKKFASCLLFVDCEFIERYKKFKGYEKISVKEFLKSNIMKNRMRILLDSINSKLNHWEHIRDYRFILEIPSIESGELTPTMKLRRHIINNRYKDLIDEIYSDCS